MPNLIHSYSGGSSSKTSARPWTTAGFRSSGRSASASSCSADVFADGHDVLAAALLYRPRGRRRLARNADGAARERSLAGAVRGRRARRVRVHGRRLGRPVRDLAAWAVREDRGRAGCRRASCSREEAWSEASGGSWGQALAGICGSGARRRRGAPVGRARIGRALSTDAGRCDGRGARSQPRDAVRPHPRRHRSNAKRARFGAWYEMFPRSAGTDPTRSATFDEAAALLPYIKAMGFDVLYLPPIHPIGRSFRKGRNNSLEAQPGRSRQPVGDRLGGGRPHGDRAGARHARRFRPVRRGRASARPRDRARPRLPGLARPSLGPGAPGVVPAAAGRHDQVRREPAQEVSGHLPDQLRVGGLAGAVGRAEAGHRVLDRPRRDDLPRRQPAHQAAALLGVGDRRDQARRTRRRSSCRKRSRVQK